MKCCAVADDSGHFKWDSDKVELLRSPVVMNNLHKFGGAGVQTCEKIYGVLQEISNGSKE